MKKAVFISFILLISGCKNNLTDIRYYPSDRGFSEQTSERIGLDTTTLNFRGLTSKVSFNQKNQGNLIIEFDDGRIKKKITPYVYDGGLILNRNVLPITSD